MKTIKLKIMPVLWLTIMTIAMFSLPVATANAQPNNSTFSVIAFANPLNNHYDNSTRGHHVTIIGQRDSCTYGFNVSLSDNNDSYSRDWLVTYTAYPSSYNGNGDWTCDNPITDTQSDCSNYEVCEHAESSGDSMDCQITGSSEIDSEEFFTITSQSYPAYGYYSGTLTLYQHGVSGNDTVVPCGDCASLKIDNVLPQGFGNEIQCGWLNSQGDPVMDNCPPA